MRQVSHLNELDVAALKRGSGAVDHRLASDHAFVVEADVRGLTVLLVEDTFTTGARAQSASSALRLAGAARVSVLTVRRVIDPGHNDNCQRIWRQARAQLFDFSRCCLEG